MNRKLNENEIEILKNLYSDKQLIGKSHIRQFLLLNTYEPKYKIGDFVLITDLSTRIYGNVAKNIKCKITNIDYWFKDKGQEQITYEAIALDQNGNDYFMCAEEKLNGEPTQRHITGRCENNINQIEKKSKDYQSTNF